MPLLKRLLPFLLLVVFVLAPAAAIGVAGLRLLARERDHWEAQTARTDRRGLIQAADSLRDGLDQLRAELHGLLLSLPAGDPADALRELAATHPLVRTGFWILPDGEAALPPANTHLDPEGLRFRQRYAALLEGRAEWTAAAADPEPLYTKAPLRLRQVQDSFRRQDIEASYTSSPSTPLHWRPWRWEDADYLLAYLRRPNGDLVGIEVEISAVFARLDVMLRLLASPVEMFALLDRADRVLLASQELPGLSPQTEEIGPILPFARLAHYRMESRTPLSGDSFYWLAAGTGLFLLLSITAAGIGLTAWLNRSRRTALQKTSFVSNVSHEFKTPLTTLRLYSELLLEGRIHDEAKRERYLRTLRDESDRLARLVHNVLDFSRLEMGRKAPQPADLDLSELLQSVFSSLQERFDAAGMRVTLPEGPLPVRADPDAANRILLNLLDNALKYAASGKALAIRAEPRGRLLEIDFADRGPGIPRRFRRKLFQPFSQADDRITRESGGTGLGLHLARRLARDNGGDLTLIDTPVGACFRWTLPRRSP